MNSFTKKVLGSGGWCNRFREIMGQRQSKPKVPSPPARTKVEVSVLREKVQLVWVLRYCRPQVSFSVVRFICSEYLDICIPIATYFSNQIHLHYNSRRNSWQDSFAGPNIPIHPGSSIVYLCGRRVMLLSCGSHSRSAIVLDSDVTEIATASNWPHLYAGVIYERALNSVFVFGGYNAADEDAYCEQYLLPAGIWRKLKKMNCGRSRFNPCSTQGLIYLSGGRKCNLETYEPRTNTFTVISLPVPDHFASNSSLCVVDEGVLSVVFSQHIFRREGNEWKCSFMTSANFDFWSNCYPIMTAGTVYCAKLYANCVIEIDLDSLNIRWK